MVRDGTGAEEHDLAAGMIMLGVFAHPDDECTCAGGVFAMHAEATRVVVVSCTDGEFGDDVGGAKPGTVGHDPARVAATRRAELDAACGRLNVSTVERLGYHDSGMPGWAALADRQVFSEVPVDTVAAEIGALLRKHQPDVVFTHNADAGHEHIDHRHAARATALAVRQLDRPITLYFSGNGAERWRRLREALAQNGIHRPEPDPGRQRTLDLVESRITTRVDLGPAVRTKRAALFEHRSQLGSSSAAQLTAQQYEDVFGVESFVRVYGDEVLPTVAR